VLLWHGVAGGDVRFGVATWFGDVLVRFGYDLFEHEHPWRGEWIDDAFESAALDLRSTGAKLVRALDRVDEDDPLSIDLVVAYLRRVLDDLAVVIPNCFGVDGRSMPRGDLRGLGLAPPVTLDFPTHSASLYPVIDASEEPALPKATARVVEESRAVTREAIASLDESLAALCPWFDTLLARVQREVASRAEDGDDLLARWAATDWSVIGHAGPGALAHLPSIR
jgi:hypothetical protein